jgi:hypothetical protein
MTVGLVMVFLVVTPKTWSKKEGTTGREAQVVELLPGKGETLSSNSSTTKKKKKTDKFNSKR